jgi:hypothetical protein
MFILHQKQASTPQSKRFSALVLPNQQIPLIKVSLSQSSADESKNDILYNAFNRSFHAYYFEDPMSVQEWQ